MLTTVSRNKSFGGMQCVYSHESRETGCVMRFGVFLPPQAEARKRPVLYWLSGLTCTEENFIVKAGAQRVAAELGLAIVVPDTSPRGLKIPGEDASYDFGLGAGVYVSHRSRAHGHLRPFHGRTRRAHHRAQESRLLQVGVGLCADLLGDALA